MTIRVLAAAAVLVSGLVHLYLWLDGFRTQDVIGPAFMVNAVSGVVIAALLLAWRHWLPAFLAFGFGVATLGAFVTSATVGLFGLHESWEGWAVWTAAGSEIVAIVTGALLVLWSGPLRSRGRLQHGAAAEGPNLH
jgi:hypothetical protein